MIIQCQGCQKKYNIDEKKLLPGVKSAKCKICGQSILFNFASLQATNLPAKTNKLCPKCGHQLNDPKQNECPACGIILNKFKEFAKRKIEDDKRRKNREEQAKKQNLIECAACKKEISKNAKTCPHCGEPLKPIKNELSKEEQDLSKFGCGA